MVRTVRTNDMGAASGKYKQKHKLRGLQKAAAEHQPTTHDTRCSGEQSRLATVMSNIRGGRGGTTRGRGTSTSTAQPGGAKTARPPFAPRGRANNQVRFNGQPRGGATVAAPGERGARGGSRGSYRGRGKSTIAATPSPSSSPAFTPAARPSPNAFSSSSSSYPERFQALKKQRESERTQAIAQGFLADPDKPRTLAEAITPVGTCPDMCPEFECVERVVQKDVWGPEQEEDGSPAEHRMVKKFRRAAAGLDEQLPSDLRPPPALKKTVDYLFNDIVADADSLGSVHHFVWDRTRAIRNDFSIQQITKPNDVQIAIECYERIARFHILSLHQLAIPEKPYDKYDWYQEREQLDRTLLSLMQYYDDSRGRVHCKNEAEFRAYLIIFQAQDPTPDLEERVNTWPLSVRSDRRVRIALDLNSAASNVVDPQGPLKPRALYPVAREDWSRFFDLVRSNKVSYLMACVAEIYFKLVRRTALNAIWRGFKGGQVPDFTLSLMTDLLGFDNDEQTEDFCQHFGFVFKPSENGESFLVLNSVQGKTLPQEAAGLDHQTFSERLVESKRMGRVFPAVINGNTVVDAQNSGLIEEGFVDDSQMEDSQVEEDEDSLFVPQADPKPVFGAAKDPPPSSSPFASFPGASNQIAEAPSSSSPFAGFSAQSKNVPESAPSSSPFASFKPSAFSQPLAAFGRPSDTSAAPSSFNFGKASSTSQAEPVASTASPFSGIKPHSPSNPFGLKPLPGPMSVPQSPTTTPDSFGTKATETPAPSNPFSSPQVLASSEPPSSAAVGPNTTAPPANGFGAASGETSGAFSNSPFASAAPAVSAAPSIFATPSSITPQPAPSFSFPSTHSFPSTQQTAPQQQALFQPPSSSSGLGNSLFTSPVAGNKDTSSSPKAEPPGQSAASIFSKPPPDASSNTSSPGSAFAITPPTPAIGDSPAAIPSAAPAVTSKSPSFSFTQPNQPKKPSPLSQSFTVTETSEAAKVKAPEAQQPPSIFSSGETPQTTLATPSTVSKSSIKLPPPRLPDPPKSKDEILSQLAREIVVDPNTGLIRQFVEYHARQTVMSVYDELYMESIRELADTFRKETLSYRYGKRWREICWRRRLARQGRERRKRAKKDQSAREMKRKLATEKNAVDDFLKSTSEARNLGTSLNGSRVGRRDVDNTAPANPEYTAPPGPTNYPHGHKRLKSVEDIDHNKHKADEVPEPMASPSTHFLGFSMHGSKSRPAIPSTPSRSNYFRLKALGITPGGDASATPLARKRVREDSDEASAEISPPTKRSRTPPLITSETPRVRPQSLTTRTETAVDLTGGSPAPALRKESFTKAREEDEELFARARAARQAMAQSGAWYKQEIQKDEDRRKEEMSRSLVSPSMQRAREAARLRASQNARNALESNAATLEVPAYRMRESRFVPREQYSRAIELAKSKIEARTRSPGQGNPRIGGSTVAMTFSSPSGSPYKSLRGRQTATQDQFSTIDNSQKMPSQGTMDSLAQFTTVHKAPEDPAWQYDPSLFATSIDPSLSLDGANGFAEPTSINAYPEIGLGQAIPANGVCTEIIDIESDQESESAQKDVQFTHDNGYPVESVTNTEDFDEEEDSEVEDSNVSDEEDMEGTAQDLEEYDEEEEYDEDDDEGGYDGFDEETDDGNGEYPPPSSDNANSTIKAGTGTAEDAFELSD